VTEALVWREAYALGVELLDAQHREMVRLINLVLDSEAGDEGGARLDALIAHLRRHFETEEVFLRAIDYPLTEEHSREHSMQLAEFVDLRRSIARGDESVGAEIRAEVRQWFFNHVVAEDRRFGAYYRRVVCGAAE
jgi:hemerythrin